MGYKSRWGRLALIVGLLMLWGCGGDLVGEVGGEPAQESLPYEDEDAVVLDSMDLDPADEEVRQAMASTYKHVYEASLYQGRTNSLSVKRLQYVLRTYKGFPSLKVTGDFTYSTAKAVQSWQEKIGHGADPYGDVYLGPVQTGMMFDTSKYCIHYKSGSAVGKCN